MDRRAFALKTLLNHPDTKLIATVNCEDNFTLWAAPIVWDAIIESFGNLTDTKEVEEFNKLCDEATVVEVDRRYHRGMVATREYKDIRATKSPLVKAVCHEAYEEIKASW